MPRGKAEQAEVIIRKLREVKVELGGGKTVAEAVKKIGVTEQTYSCWKKQYGGLRMGQAKRLNEPEKENARLERLLAARNYGSFALGGLADNHKRVERIRREEGLEVPHKQHKRRRLWLNDGSCIRLRPTHRNHVWSYDFVMDRTSDGRPNRMLTIVDDYTGECPAIDVAKRLTREDVVKRPNDLFVRRGVPKQIRSDNGSELTARSVRELLGRVGVKTL